MAKIVIREYSNPGEKVADEYVKSFLKDVRRWSPEGIDYMRNLEAISDFYGRYAKRQNLNRGEIVQGANEINLAVDMYNILNSEYGKN